MSADEVKAIEELEILATYDIESAFPCVFAEKDAKNVFTVLNLIKKQKEELDKEKEKNKIHIEHIENLDKRVANQRQRLRTGINFKKLNTDELCKTFNLISKDKIRELLEKYDKSIAWANADDHYYFTKFIKELLEGSNV